MASHPANFDGFHGTVVGTTDCVHPNALFEDIFDYKNPPSSQLEREWYLQDDNADVRIHNSSKENPTSRSSKYSNAETQQQNSNPPKTESIPKKDTDGWSIIQANESNLLEYDQRANPYAHMSSLSPGNQFRRDTSIAIPVPRTAKQPAAATSDGEQSSTNPVNQFPIESPSADVLTTLKITPVPRTAKRPAATTLDDGQSQKRAKSWTRAKTRISLPLTLNANSGPATVLACPDTGSEENIISLDLAQALGYNILTSPFQNRTFELANGVIVEAIGEIIAECSFGIETTPAAVPMVLMFYVFMKLASPIIMGLAFLEQTGTLSKHRDRLLRVPRAAHQPIQVYSMGRPRNQMHCFLNSVYVQATPDSGSEVNLMARSFASESGFHIENAKEVVEFADGTIAVTSGVVRENLAVGYDAFLIIDFYLMDDLRHDLIVGDDSLEELEVFTKRGYTLFSSPCTFGSAELSRIRHLGAVDHMLSWVKKKISLTRRPHRVPISTQVSPNDSLADQRENDRREREEIRIINLPVDQREGAIAAEALKQAQYDNTAGGP